MLELIAEAVLTVTKFAGRLIVELVFEKLLAGAGRLAIRLFKPGSAPGTLACITAGILVWFVVGAACFVGYRVLMT